MDATLTLTFHTQNQIASALNSCRCLDRNWRNSLWKKTNKKKNVPVISWRNGHGDIYAVWKHRLRLPDCSNSRSGAYKSIPSPPCEYIMTVGQNRTLILVTFMITAESDVISANKSNLSTISYKQSLRQIHVCCLHMINSRGEKLRRWAMRM